MQFRGTAINFLYFPVGKSFLSIIPPVFPRVQAPVRSLYQVGKILLYFVGLLFQVTGVVLVI